MLAGRSSPCELNSQHMEGWIKLHRRFLEWEWYQDSNMVRLFLHLLLMANHKDRRWKGLEIKRGQLITGLPTLAEQTGLSVQSIRTCLSKLEKSGEINRQTNSQHSLITVSGYETYQGEGEDINSQTNSQATGKQQSSNIQLTTNKKVNKENNRKKRERFSPPSVDQVKEYVSTRTVKIDALKFHAHYESNGWMRGKNQIKDWTAAVRYWEQSEKSETKQTKRKDSKIW